MYEQFPDTLEVSATYHLYDSRMVGQLQQKKCFKVVKKAVDRQVSGMVIYSKYSLHCIYISTVQTEQTVADAMSRVAYATTDGELRTSVGR